jgi:uncharacterized heparinase superfamily protein
MQLISIPKQIQYIASKGADVIAYRGWQLLRQKTLKNTNYWSRLTQRSQSFWNQKTIDQWMSKLSSERSLINNQKSDSVKSYYSNYTDQKQAILDYVEDIANGKFKIFDQDYSLDLDNLPWHTDWRWNHTWSPAYYKTYSFYEVDKPSPYDVKFPWELSRLSFLPILAQAAVISGDGRWRNLAVELATDWANKNPVAYSVNWNPMECSMRAINLVLAVQILRTDASQTGEDLTPLLQQLILHGEFIDRNIEYTNLRGNHYTANIVALLVLGDALAGIYPPAQRWLRSAIPLIGQEIELQYCDDGVNYEKSVAYHRLVTELFLLGAIVLEQRGVSLSTTAYKRLHDACNYTCHYVRPDGLAPNIGDNDSAYVFGLDLKPIRDHRNLLALAAAFFQDAEFKTVAQSPSVTIAWLLGEKGVANWKELKTGDLCSPRSFFGSGGIFIAQGYRNYLIADFGEVGQKGLGGHGHNDTFSFELCLDGEPIIVDSGSETYTGDLSKYDRYRSTAAHNTVMVDGEEIAPLLKTWRISNRADPQMVKIDCDRHQNSIEGEHHGYLSLKDPLVHRRKLTFSPEEGSLLCEDSFCGDSSHNVKQFLHFPFLKNVAVDDSTKTVVIDTFSGNSITIQFNAVDNIQIESYSLSSNYAQSNSSQYLTIESAVSGTQILNFSIRKQQGSQKFLF